ncbi:MAG: hypothetical protein AVDCRST_MAG49-2580, partial [uncultured Thermomicrobiales bacterium]
CLPPSCSSTTRRSSSAWRARCSRPTRRWRWSARRAAPRRRWRACPPSTRTWRSSTSRCPAPAASRRPGACARPRPGCARSWSAPLDTAGTPPSPARPAPPASSPSATSPPRPSAPPSTGR